MVEIGLKPGSALFPVCIVGDAGGVHVRTRALAMARLGHEVHLVTPRSSSLRDLNESVPVAGRFADMPFLRLFNQAAQMADHARRLRAAPGDIVHVHYACSLGAWLFAASGDRRPLVVSVMGGDILFDEQGNPSRPARWLIRQVLRRADLVTAKSDYLAARLLDLGVAGDRIEKVLWGVDTDIFRPGDSLRSKADLGLPEAAPVIFSPRILTPFYRTDVIVRALPAVLAEYPEAKLVITEYEADPVYKRQLETLAQELGVAESIVFTGVVPHQRMADYYNAADVAVGIPPSDGFPQTVLEAMACGTPNVVARLNRYEEILTDRESAIFVDPTTNGVAAAIVEILRDRELADRLRSKGLEIVDEKADLNREAARVSQIYQRLQAERPRQPLALFVRLAAKAILGGLVVRNGLKSAFGGMAEERGQ